MSEQAKSGRTIGYLSNSWLFVNSEGCPEIAHDLLHKVEYVYSFLAFSLLRHLAVGPSAHNRPIVIFCQSPVGPQLVSLYSPETATSQAVYQNALGRVMLRTLMGY